MERGEEKVRKETPNYINGILEKNVEDKKLKALTNVNL